MLKLLLHVLIIAMSACASLVHADVALIQNASFESPPTTSSTQADYMTGSKFPQNDESWTISSGNIRGGVEYWEYAAPHGKQHMWANLSQTGQFQAASISQVIGPATESSKYTLTFCADIPGATTGGVVVWARLYIGSRRVANLSSSAVSAYGWQYYTLPSYTATSVDAGQSMKIEIGFSNLSSSSDRKIVLDNVVLYDYRAPILVTKTAYNPFPGDFSEGLGQAITLTWTAGSDSVSHNLYFGSDYASVLDANNPTQSPGKGIISGNSFNPGALNINTTYFWRVDEIDANGTIYKGDVWSFSTTEYSLDHNISEPNELYVIRWKDTWDTSEVAKSILMQSLAGVVAQTKPKIYIDTGIYNDMWLADLAGNYGISISRQEDPNWYLDQFKSYTSSQYVLCDDKDMNSVYAAVSLAGIHKAVAVDVSLEDTLKAHGYSLVADARGKDDQWIFDNYWNNFNHTAIVSNGFFARLYDWGIARGLFVMTAKNRSLADQVYKALADCSPKYGDYEAFSDGEGTTTSFASQHSLFLSPYGGVYNLPVYAGMYQHKPSLKFKQKVRGKTFTKERGVHYVTFLMSDMDNTTITTQAKWLNDTFNNPHRGDFAVGWGLSQSMLKDAPSIVDWLYRNATDRDCFVVPLSGMGFCYPEQFPALEKQVNQLERYMERSDTRIVTIQDWPAAFNSAYITKVIKKYSQIKCLRGMFLDGSLAGQGIIWDNGKPIIPLKYYLWSGIETPQSLSTKINAGVKNPGDLNSYSAVYVHVWTNGLREIAQAISLFDPNVRVVTPDEFVEQLYMNFTPEQINIPNRSFEYPQLAKDGYTAGGYSPGDDFYRWSISSGQLWGGLDYTNSTVPDGLQNMWAFLDPSGDWQYFSISQQLTTAKPGVEYTASFYGYEPGFQGYGAEITGRLIVGDDVAATISIASPSKVNWEKYTLPAYRASVSDNNKPVKIEIMAQNKGSQKTKIVLDKIELRAHIAGDGNNDGVVDMADLLILAQHWLFDGATAEQGNYDNIGKVDFSDFTVLAQNWLKSLW